MEKLKIGDRIIITDIESNSLGSRYWSSSHGIQPQNIQLPYETTVRTFSDDKYQSFGDGTYGFWGEKTTWRFAEPNYEIY